MSSQVWSLNEIPDVEIRRMPTGIPEMDLVYGKSILSGGTTETGFPKGKISYWAGERGVGKTRLAIVVSKLINKMGAKILVIQGEVLLHEFKQLTGTVAHPKNYFISDTKQVDNIVPLINRLKPHLVIIDSANMVEGFESRQDIKDIFSKLREAISVIGGHIIMIGQLNQDGSTKGGTRAPHLVDTVALLKIYHENIKQSDEEEKRMSDQEFSRYLDRLREAQDKTKFIFEIGKHRYGKRGGKIIFEHVKKGIRVSN